MNERIKLPAQEWLGYDPERGDLHGYTFEQMREFAELIVEECIDVVAAGGEFASRPKLVEQLQRHFGIKELNPCRSPYCECDVGKCSHPGFYDARAEE